MSQAVTFMENRTLLDGDTKTASMDLGAGRQFGIHIRVLKDGTAGTITFEHSAVDEDAAFEPFGTARALNATGNYPEIIDGYLRYVRVVASSVEGGPVVSAYGIAKE